MTLSADIAFESYTIVDENAPLNFGHMWEFDDELAVFEDGVLLDLGADYSLVGATLPGGGTVNPVAATIGSKWVIYRMTRTAQVSSPSDPVAGFGLDRITRMVQDVRRDVDRSLKVDFDETNLRSIPRPVEPGKALIGDDDGQGFHYSTINVDDLEGVGEAAEAAAIAAGEARDAAVVVLGQTEGVLDATEAARDEAVAAAALSAARVYYVQNTAAIKTLLSSTSKVAEIFSEGGRNGTFDSIIIADQTAAVQAEIAADTLEGMYIKSTVEPLRAWRRRAEKIDPEFFGSTGAAFNAALAFARLRGTQRGTGPEAVYLMSGDYAPAGGFDVDDTLIYIAPGSKLYGNTSHGWTQRIKTLPPNFNDFTVDPINVVRYFDGQVKDTVNPLQTNGLLKAGAAGTLAVVFGLGAPAIGTPLSLRLTTEVYDVGTPDIGYNEIGGLYNHIIVHGDRAQPASKYSIWALDTIANTGKNRPKWFGASFRYHYMSPANSNGGFGTGEGLSGISVMQRPLYAGDATYSGFLPTDPVYPMAAGITISGYGGPQSATDGTHADALHAFYNGLQIGGANSPYLGETSRSKLLNGISIADYTLQGIVITNPHPSFNPAAGSGAAIAIAANAGIVNLGVGTPSGTAALHVRHAANGNVKLYQAEGQSANKQSVINFNNIGSLGTDLGATNVNVFAYYHTAAAKYGFLVDANGNFALSNPPTSAAGLPAGTLWKDNAAGGVIKAA